MTETVAIGSHTTGRALAERHNAAVDAGEVDLTTIFAAEHPWSDVVCGWCGKFHFPEDPQA